MEEQKNEYRFDNYSIPERCLVVADEECKHYQQFYPQMTPENFTSQVYRPILACLIKLFSNKRPKDVIESRDLLNHIKLNIQTYYGLSLGFRFGKTYAKQDPWVGKILYQIRDFFPESSVSQKIAMLPIVIKMLDCLTTESD